MKILVATEKPFAPVAIRQIREIVESEGHELALLENYTQPSELRIAVREANALIVRSDIVDKTVIDAAPALKIVIRAGAGYDNLDLEACSAHGVVAMNTPGQNSNAVAELVFEMLLYHARGGFSGRVGTELRNKTIGIHAFGNVGRYVAGIARGFGMKVYAYDPFVGKDVLDAAGVIACKSVADLYSSCQYISLHMPAGEKTNRSVVYDLLASMPVPALLVNTARKEIINENDLLRMFETRPDFVYLADIEPDCRKVIEERFSGRFLFTAVKMGAQTGEANINAGVAAARQIVDYFRTGNEKFRLNK